MSGFDLTFNWFYADSKHIAMYSSGRLPLRAPGVNPGLPTVGTGEYEWRGFLAPNDHVHAVDPASGEIVNWNNKPGAGFGAADDNFAFGSVQRVQLLTLGLTAAKQTPTSVVAAMSWAATQDLRRQLVALLRDVLARTPAPSPLDQQLVDLLVAWDGTRLDRDGDGRIDDPGAAIMDAAWPGIAQAVLSPVLGPLTSQLAQPMSVDNAANSGGSSYGGGWYGYVDKDLRALTGAAVQKPFSRRYCGTGDVLACSRSQWAALDAAGRRLAAAQGSDPTAWRADAGPERIRFAGFLPTTMRWTNRPTFQQVISFARHR